jgi:chromosome segregation ATPase
LLQRASGIRASIAAPKEILNKFALLDEAHNRVSTFKAELNRLEDLRRRCEAEGVILQAHLRNLIQELKNKRGLLGFLKRSRDAIEQDLFGLHSRIRENSAQQQICKTSREALIRRLDAAVLECNGLTSDVRGQNRPTLERVTAAAEGQIASIQQQITDVEERIAALRTEIVNWRCGLGSDLYKGIPYKRHLSDGSHHHR